MFLLKRGFANIIFLFKYLFENNFVFTSSEKGRRTQIKKKKRKRLTNANSFFRLPYLFSCTKRQKPENVFFISDIYLFFCLKSFVIFAKYRQYIILLLYVKNLHYKIV